MRYAIIPILTLLAACGGGGAATAPTDPVQQPTFTSLNIDPGSGNLAVGGTLQLSARAVDGSGAPMTGVSTPSWQSSNPSVATVSAAGLVTAAGAGVTTVTATATLGQITRTASAQVNVAAALGAPTAATVQGVDDGFAPAAVTIAAGGTVTWTMSDEEHDITWDGPAPPGGNVPRLDDGESATRTFPTAGTYAYHCAHHDSHAESGTVVVQGSGGAPPSSPPTQPAAATVTATTNRTFSPPSVTIAAGGTVSWQFADFHNVTFTGNAPAGGSIANTGSGTVSRQFTTPGSYPYQCTLHSGMTGTVVVQ